MYFSLFNAGIVAATAIPFNGAIKSDGRVVVELWRNDEHTNAYLSSILLTKEMMTPAHPTTWSSHLVEQARQAKASEETVMNGYVLFYYDVLTHGFEQASASLTAFKALPVTKKNKMTLQSITHVKQLDLVWSDEATVDKLQVLHADLLAMEPISYKRSEWLIAHLAGEEQLAQRKLAEHLKQLEQGKKQFGFYYAEAHVTELLIEKLNKKMLQHNRAAALFFVTCRKHRPAYGHF